MNSKASYCEVVFPVRLGALTYAIPEEMLHIIRPGMLVEAPLRGSLKRGIVLRLMDYDPERQNIVAIKRHVVESPLLSNHMLRLLQWMSDYYVSDPGTVLKAMVPSFIFKKKRLNISLKKPNNSEAVRRAILNQNSWSQTRSTDRFIKDFEFIKGLKNFSPFLVKGSLKEEFFIKFFSDISDGLILVPSVEMAVRLSEIFKVHYGERVVAFHGQLKASELQKNYIRTLQGGCILIGTRNAIFAPFRPLMILVLDEGANSYKDEESPFFNARDVAVMRAYIERLPVLLLSSHPSIESFYNAHLKKYRFIDLGQRSEVSVKIQRFKKDSNPAPLSEDILNQIEESIKRGKRVLITMPSTGYSIIYCRECGRVLRCDCEGVFVYYKVKGHLRCRLCEKEIKVPSICPYCKGIDLEERSAGIERIKEILEKRFNILKEQDAFTIMPRAACAPQDSKQRFHLGIILDADIILNMPDYRASERLFHEVYYLAERIVPEGDIILRTRIPGQEVFKYIKRFDYKGFALSELRLRRLNNLPPFSKYVLLKIASKRPVKEEDIHKRLETILANNNVSVRKISVKKRKKALPYQTAYLLRLKRQIPSSDIKILITDIQQMGIDVRVEVDPS